MMSREETYSLQEMIRWAMAEQTDREIDALPTPAELDEMFPDTAHLRRRVFDAVKQREKEEKRAKRRILPMVKRTLLVAAVLAALLFGTLMTNASVRSAVVNTIIEWTGRDVGISFQIEGQPPAALPEDYGPHYIPEGFEYREDISWRDEEGMFFTYESEATQVVLDIDIHILGNISYLKMDNEHIQYEKITFNNNAMYLGTFEDQSGYVLLWVNNGIKHSIYGTINLSELFKIAENIY